MAQLTSNTDNKGQLFVTVFAGICSTKTINYYVIKSPRPQSPLRCDIGAPPAGVFKKDLCTLTCY